MNSEVLSGVAGLFLNYVVEFVKAKLPKTKGKWLGYVLGYGACLLVGAVTAFFEGKLDRDNILSSAAAAMITSQGYYNLYFKPKKVDVKLARKFS